MLAQLAVCVFAVLADMKPACKRLLFLDVFALVLFFFESWCKIVFKTYTHVFQRYVYLWEIVALCRTLAPLPWVPNSESVGFQLLLALE